MQWTQNFGQKDCTNITQNLSEMASRHEIKSGNLTLYYGFDEMFAQYYYFILDAARPVGTQCVISRKTSSGLTNIEFAETLKRFEVNKEHIAAVLMNKPI